MSSGTFVAEISLGCWSDFETGLIHVDCDENEEILVEVEVNWYYDPGVWYLPNGDPGYPPESDEERIITYVTLGNYKFTEDELEKLASLFSDAVEEYEFDEEYYR